MINPGDKTYETLGNQTSVNFELPPKGCRFEGSPNLNVNIN